MEARDGIEQVREILFGAIQRDLERKLGRAEAHLSARLTEIQQETRRRTDVIEAHLRKEVEAMSTRVDAELVEVKDGLRALARDGRETGTATEQRVAKLEDALSRAQHDLRAQILDQAKSFLDELQRARAEIGETLDRELAAFELEPEEEPERRGSEVSASPAP